MTKPLPSDIVVYDPVTTPTINKDEDETSIEALETDVEEARENIKNLITKGDKALNYAIELAQGSDRASAFEAVSSLLKTLVDSNTQLIDLHKKKQDIKKNVVGGEVKEEGKTVNHNTAVFIGTTAELNELIKKNRGA